jgi:hypothetical protein
VQWHVSLQETYILIKINNGAKIFDILQTYKQGELIMFRRTPDEMLSVWGITYRQWRLHIAHESYPTISKNEVSTNPG